MNIAICGSLDFTYEIKNIARELSQQGHTVRIPLSSERILRDEVTLDKIKEEKESGTFFERAIRFDSIREYWNIIQECDAILVANFDKRGVKNYIGGNTFLEMGFAHVLRKPIYLLNGIPDLFYKDEIKAMQPVIINGDISLIQKKN